MKPEPIEAVMWRTLKILRQANYDTWLQAINITHPCTRQRLTRYIHHLQVAELIHTADVGRHAIYRIAPSAPATAPIFRKKTK